MQRNIGKYPIKAIRILTRCRMIFLVSIHLPFTSAQNSAPSLTLTPPEMNDPARFTCATCSKTPESINDFISMTYQIMTILDASNPSNTVVGGYKIYGPRQGGVYGAFQNSLAPYPSIVDEVVGGTLRNIDRQQSSMRSIAIVFGIYGRDILTDGARGLAVIAQPWPIVRDYQKLLNIDSILADKIFDLGQAGGLQKKLTTDAKQSIMTVLASQQGDGKLFDSKTASTTIESNATPYNVIQLLLRINRRMKNIVTAGRNPTDQDIIIKTDAIRVQINPGFRTGIKEEYSCTRLGNNACTQQWKDFTKSVKSISTGFIESGPKEARETIKTALTRLKTRSQDIGGKDENISDKNRADYDMREKEILSSLGVQKHNFLSSGSFDVSASLPRDFQDMKQTVKDIGQGISSYRSGANESNNNSSKRNISEANEIVQQIYQTDSKGVMQTTEPGIVGSIMSRLGGGQTTTEATLRQSKIRNTITEIEVYHQSAMSEQAIASSDDSQLLLANLLASIRYIKDTIYNTSNKETIYENIVRTCETQCANLGGICR